MGYFAGSSMQVSHQPEASATVTINQFVTIDAATPISSKSVSVFKKRVHEWILKT
jgi:hypothetical protein